MRGSHDGSKCPLPSPSLLHEPYFVLLGAHCRLQFGPPAMSEPAQSIASRLNDCLAAAGLDPLDEATAARFAAYCTLLLRWNARTNLTAIRDEEGILSRHFVESIACARALPPGIAALLDFGSGAGFPGIPIALCHPEIAVTLAESQGKKAAFLQEAVRTLGISAKVHSGRAESLAILFDCVTLRSVDHMSKALQAATNLVASGGWLVLLTTEGQFMSLRAASVGALSWLEPLPLPGSDSRLFVLAQTTPSSRP
jgi:16S rRNA (guanine527-N7)-methyltransferase